MYRDIFERNDEDESVDDSIDEVYVGRPPREDPTHFDTYWKFTPTLASVVQDSEAINNGDCGYDSLQHTIRSLLPSGTPLPDWLEPTPEGRLKLRIKIYDYAILNAAIFTNDQDPVVVGVRDKPVKNVYVSKRGSFHKNCGRVFSPELMEFFRRIIPRKYWLQPDFVLPIAVHMLKRSMF